MRRWRVGTGIAGAGAPRAAVEEPTTTALGPMGIVEMSSSLKKSKVVGSKGVVDMLVNEKDDSSNTTCRETMILLE